MNDLEPEDAKLVNLARATWARTGAAEGAAVRDQDGRTYVAATVSLPSLALSALEVAVATAASSGASDLEAAAVVRAVVGDVGDGIEGIAAVRELGGEGAPVFVADGAGTVAYTARA
jgi:hypothetical protein